MSETRMKTADEVAQILHMAPRSLRRFLAELGFHGHRGKRRLFTEQDVQFLVEKRSCLSIYASAESSGTRAARSALPAVKPSRSQSSALAAVLELTQKPSPKPRNTASGKRPSKGQRAA